LLFAGADVSAGYFTWPKLPELLPVSFPGVKTSRDEFLVAIDREALAARVDAYFDEATEDGAIKARYPCVMAASGRFDPLLTRRELLARGIKSENIILYAYRPFDLRWAYWDPDTKLLDEKRADYWESRVDGKYELVIPRAQRKEWSPPMVTSSLLDLNAMDGGASAIPFETRIGAGHDPAVNVPGSVLKLPGNGGKLIFFHCLSILHSPQYFLENGGAMRIESPRVPFPADAATLKASAALGASLTQLLDPATPAPGVSAGKLRPGLATLALPTKRGATALAAADLALTAGWGSTQGTGSGATIVMPGRGLTATRDYMEAERKALAKEGAALGLSEEEVLTLLGQKTLDVHLNADAFWSNVPEKVWSYTLGGYQVVKKWLSYREQAVLGRALKPEEVAYVSEMVRRIAAILLMGPALDKNYEAAKANAVEWKDGRPVT
jgi:hypothetical protein